MADMVTDAASNIAPIQAQPRAWRARSVDDDVRKRFLEQHAVVSMRAGIHHGQRQAMAISEQAALDVRFAAVGRVRIDAPTQRGLGHRAIQRHPAPVDLFQRFARQQPFMSEALERTGIGPVPKAPMRRRVRA